MVTRTRRATTSIPSKCFIEICIPVFFLESDDLHVRMREASTRERTHVLVHKNAAIIARINHLLPAGQRKANHAMELPGFICSDIRIMIGRLDKHGLHGMAQRAKLILPNPMPVPSRRMMFSEPVDVAKRARRARSTVIVRLTLCLYYVKYQRHVCPLGLM